MRRPAVTQMQSVWGLTRELIVFQKWRSSTSTNCLQELPVEIKRRLAEEHLHHDPWRERRMKWITPTRTFLKGNFQTFDHGRVDQIRGRVEYYSTMVESVVDSTTTRPRFDHCKIAQLGRWSTRPWSKAWSKKCRPPESERIIRREIPVKRKEVLPLSQKG